MLLETPFHPRTAALCRSRRWRNWSGYAAALSYEPGHEYEYYAVRSGAALFDVSPLRKYEVTGPDAAALMDRVMTRTVFRCAVGRVLYTPWCDEAGKLIDDGTVQRLRADAFRVTAADPLPALVPGTARSGWTRRCATSPSTSRRSRCRAPPRGTSSPGS